MDKHTFNQLYKKALKLVYQYHKDMVDKGGNPYINHLLYVSNNCNTYESKIAGLLHDILEDTQCTEYVLLENNIPKEIVDAVKFLTKNNNEAYNEYIDRLINSKNTIALEVKLWDLSNNMDLDRLKDVTKKDLDRVSKRYKPAKEKILKTLNEIN